jgi:hypothetical protein
MIDPGSASIARAKSCAGQQSVSVFQAIDADVMVGQIPVE